MNTIPDGCRRVVADDYKMGTKFKTSNCECEDVSYVGRDRHGAFVFMAFMRNERGSPAPVYFSAAPFQTFVKL